MILETAFRSANPAMLFRVPSFFEWFLNTDTHYGYEVHRAWLQHLQWRNPRARWVLKVQEHMYHMPELVAAYGGAISAEHGIGVAKRDFLHLSRSAAEIEAMGRVKRALDPKWILNPGCVLGDRGSHRAGQSGEDPASGT